jgi:hypothetical protein
VNFWSLFHSKHFPINQLPIAFSKIHNHIIVLPGGLQYLSLNKFKLLMWHCFPSTWSTTSPILTKNSLQQVATFWLRPIVHIPCHFPFSITHSSPLALTVFTLISVLLLLSNFHCFRLQCNSEVT